MRFFTLISILFFQINSFAQSELRFLSATTGAACYDILYHNDHVFAGAGTTLMVYNLDVNRKPDQKIFEYRFTSNIDDMQVKGNKLFVAANHAGLSMWDISNMSNITMLDEYVPDSLNEAAYNIALYGDTVFVAYKSKMAVFKDNGSDLSLLTKFAHQTGTSKIRGCAIKGNILAFVAAYGSNAQTGLYLYNASTLSKYSFTQQNFCDPEETAFGINTNLLHVAGGTESLGSFGLNANGLFYSMDVTNPALPIEVFRDTLPGIIGLAISQPMNIENVNDTIFVATQSALDANYQGGDTLTGQTYVYDASNATNVHLVNSLNAGLWHFDIAVNANRMYVASEWYGIKTVDISDIINETEMGKTLTGGWNLGSDKFENGLVVGNEGFGVKLFDISNPGSPSLLASNNEIGFCMNINYSQNGDYIFGWYWTDDDFRVLDPNNLTKLASIPIFNNNVADYRKTRVWKNKAIGIQVVGSAKSIIVIDVTNPLAPFVEKTLTMNNILDIAVSENGKLFAATKDSLSVLDINNNLALLKTITPPSNFWNDFTTIAEYKDTLYVNISGLNGGLFKYHYDGNTTLTSLSNIPAPIPNYNPKCMAVDSFGLYLNYTEQGLYAFNKQSLTQIGYYRHAMEFVHNFLWGPQDVFCKDNMIFLVEYFGQTSILTMDDNLVASFEKPIESMSENYFEIFPNPADGKINIKLKDVSSAEQLKIYNLQGKLVGMHKLSDRSGQLDVSYLIGGFYTLVVESGESQYYGKLVLK